MPRHAGKKNNKNAECLPVLINLESKDINSEEQKVNKSNKNSRKCKNNRNTLKETLQKNKKINNKVEKELVNGTFTTFNRIKYNCGANNTRLNADTPYIPNKANNKNITKTFEEEATDLPQQTQRERFSKLSSKSTSTCVNSLKSSEIIESELKEQKHSCSDNNLSHFNVVLNNTTQTETNLNLTSLLGTNTKLPESTFVGSTSTSSNWFTSSLYPIVVVTSEPFQQNNRDKQLQHGVESDSNSRKNIIHSSSKNENNNNNNNNNITTISTCCHTAVDTLEQHKTLNSNCNNNNSNNITTSTTTSSSKRCNNSNQQKQSTESSTRATTKVLTLSKPPSNQSQEVKARLATLRIRKNVLEQQAQSEKIIRSRQKISCPIVAFPGLYIEEDIQAADIKESNANTNAHPTQTGKHFMKKAASVVDNATLNLIEPLTDDAKKPNRRRRNNTAAVLLGLATQYQHRPKRFAANPSTQFDKTISGSTTIPGGSHQNQATSNCLKSLSSEATNTNSKRARIMSLYERPFQTTNDGRASVVGNGYMTSSRSSASSNGGAAGAIIMNETCDTQEMPNQYYLPGGSGSAIATNSNQSLAGNGSAINHAPTMGTLCNIGNTCYLNSVVYTLRFAPQFLHNLHHLLADLNALQQNITKARAKSSSLGRGINAGYLENARSWSNKDLASMEQYAGGTPTNIAPLTTNSTALTQVTQKSSHQLLTEKLHELYQSLHRNEINESTEPHHPDTLLHAIQDVSSIFEGNQQQDAHEFLMCLLNSIRETSQTLIKAIAECPDVIINGYISNPDEIERDLINKTHTAISGVSVGGSNSSNSNSLVAASAKTSSFFSRKSKRKDESKNSKTSRLQSPLKDAHMSANSQTTTTANSLFYLNTNDLSLPVTSPASSSASATAAAVGASLKSPSNSLSCGADETDTPSAVRLMLKDKQRLDDKIKELGLDFFNEDFEGITVSTTKCLSCETITEQKETMIDIAVPVPQAGYESNEYMNRPSSFIQNSCITREYFRNENKYRCEQCCGYTEAIRSISYEVLPRLLIIQLSRFSGGMEKINSYIPTSFTLQCFCSKCCELSDANKLHIYKLYSVITHVGATMSVGHYIAYTCSLEWANEYMNCPKEQRRRASQERNLCTVGGNGVSGATGASNSSQSSTASSGLGTSSTGFMKMKMKFGRSKASSSGDMSKNVKQLNGVNTSSKAITNGIGKLTMNNSATMGSATANCSVTCQSINCCAMRLTAQQSLQYQSANNTTSDFIEDTLQYSNGSGYNNQISYNNNIQHPFATPSNTSGYGSTGRGSAKASYASIQNNCSEPIWYMCDDDKIKAMTQREFEELLSPARKITITPYLLFYARYNLQSMPPKSTATVSTSSPGLVTSSPHTSWSNESLQSSGHSAHSAGIRM